MNAEWTVLDTREQNTMMDTWIESLCISGNVIAICANLVLGEIEPDQGLATDDDIEDADNIDGQMVVSVEGGYALGRLVIVDGQNVVLKSFNETEIQHCLTALGWSSSDSIILSIIQNAIPS